VGNDCLKDPDCSKINECASVCSDASCVQHCVDSDPAGATLFNNAEQCLSCACTHSCGSTC
jgi:hypothetical protein